MVELTKSEALTLLDFIEYNIFDEIRNDEDVASMVWLCNVVEIYKKCKEEAENE